MQGIGASLSGLAAGLLVDRFGYDVAFLALGAAAALAFVVFALQDAGNRRKTLSRRDRRADQAARGRPLSSPGLCRLRKRATFRPCAE